MARRRLLIEESELRTLERPGERGLTGPSAPIAHLAGEAAAEQGREIARLREAAADAGRLRTAEAEGRVLADVPLDRIDPGFLARDRILPADGGADGAGAADEAELALRASIRAHGQRVPVELVAFAAEEGRALPFGLISGWRRLRALKALHAETGDARFATARAIVRREAGLAPAFVAMVEENEIRVGLSFYERGRIAALAARQGAYATADAAIDTLFAAGSPARRSKIRSFLALYQTLDDVLVWPEALGERLGLKLAQAVRRGEADRIREGLRAGAPAYRSAEDEQALIGALIAGRREAKRNAKVSKDPAEAIEMIDLPSGIRIERRCFAAHTELRLSGPGLDEVRLAAAIEAMRQALI